MIDTVAEVSIVWSWVVGGLGFFFVAASRRFPGRGYDLLGLTMALVSLADFLAAVFVREGAGPLGFFASRMGLLVGLFTLSINLHFLLRYCETKNSQRILWISYVGAGAAALANIMGSVAQYSHLEGLSLDVEYRSPSSAFSLYAVVFVIGHLFLSARVLYQSYRGGNKSALGILVALVLLAPAIVADIGIALLLHERWFTAQVGTWVYGLVVLGTMLSEAKDAEGRLTETSSRLAERTAELEVSYAEIDAVYTELSQKQQLAAVGELAGSIAHEVRNPLAIIMNAVSGLRRATVNETLLSIINEESERLNHLVSELLRFARPVAASRAPASLIDICNRASKEPPEGYQVKVHSIEEDALGQVLVDPGLFRLALDNLMANSAQSMEKGGTIELAVRASKCADGTLATAVDIRDSGCGMKAAEIEDAKKPFFTTKPRGTGLGIPIAVRIVEAHGGELHIKSTHQKGTTVTLKIPIEHGSGRTPSLASYPGSKHPSTRRRLRSIPPELKSDPDLSSKKKLPS